MTYIIIISLFILTDNHYLFRLNHSSDKRETYWTDLKYLVSSQIYTFAAFDEEKNQSIKVNNVRGQRYFPYFTPKPQLSWNKAYSRYFYSRGKLITHVLCVEICRRWPLVGQKEAQMFQEFSPILGRSLRKLSKLNHRLTIWRNRSREKENKYAQWS